MGIRKVIITSWKKLEHTYNGSIKLLKIYLARNERLTGKQRLTKLRVETFFSYVLLIILLILGILYIYIYYEVHHDIHIENIEFPKTGYTSISCYSNYRGTNLCCADNPYLMTSFVNSSKRPIATYECYKFKKKFNKTVFSQFS
jgi:hypothetical protein